MSNKTPQWTTISLKGLTGLLDLRSRPADMPPGSLRWRQGFSTSSEGKLCTRPGFSRAWSDSLFNADGSQPPAGALYGGNGDFHHQDGTRRPVTMQFESTASDGTRRHFAATSAVISVLDEDTGVRSNIATGQGSGSSYFTCAELQDVVIFGDGVGNVLSHDLGSTTTATVPDLMPGGAVPTSAVHVVVEYQGCVFLMNYFSGGKRRPSRIRWSDLNLPRSYDPAASIGGVNSIAGYQDLDYGDEILAAAPMQGALYIYTRRGIWRVQPSGGGSSTWSFTRVYNEPKNQTGCLLYPRTLINTGEAHWYLSRDSIYTFNPYIIGPKREEWSRRADGVIYKKADMQLSGVLCNAPCGEYSPNNRELWFSWPSGNRSVNNWTLVLNVEQEAADVVDHGFTSFINYRRTPAVGLCNEVQSLLAASGSDYAIKQIGGVFYRELLTMPGDDPTVDFPAFIPVISYQTVGYVRQLRGMIPLGLYDRDKMLRNVLFDADVTTELNPTYARLRIGNSFTLTDPNDLEPICSPQWREFSPISVACPQGKTNPQLKALNQKPSAALEWRVYECNRFLYFELTIQNRDGSPAIGGDLCAERLDFQVMAKPESSP